MELVEGQSLDRHLAQGSLPLARVLDFGIALTDALTAAHAKGVVQSRPEAGERDADAGCGKMSCVIFGSGL